MYTLQELISNINLGSTAFGREPTDEERRLAKVLDSAMDVFANVDWIDVEDIEWVHLELKKLKVV